MKKILIVLSMLSILVLSGCSSSKCDWQPKKDYGLCEAFFTAGVYYDKSEKECKVFSHSGCSKADTPFELDESAFIERTRECYDSPGKTLEQMKQCASELVYSSEFVGECEKECK